MNLGVYWSTGALVTLSVEPLWTEARERIQGQTRAAFEEVVLVSVEKSHSKQKHWSLRGKKGG